MVKETFITTDKMETTAGNWSLHGARWDHEATVISHLRKAGAVLLGKNTLGEWGNMWNSTMPSGWSARWGTARGAFYPNMHCAGSSTGCGVGASLGVAAAFIGGEVRWWWKRRTRRKKKRMDDGWRP
jgi:amidase